MWEWTHSWLLGLLRSPQIMLDLHAQPEFRRRAQCGRQPQGHSRGNAGMPIEDARQMGTSHAETGGGFLDGHIAQVIPQDFSRMRGIENHKSILF
jgi:hypothetical protein